MRSTRLIVGAWKVLLLVSAWLLAPSASANGGDVSSYEIPEYLFSADARGPYRTGTIEELWIDSRREETTTSDPADKRHLMVQIWYPADYRGDPERAHYVLHPDLYRTETDRQWLAGLKNVRTNSVLQAPVARGSEPFPVLIFNPGSSGKHFVATFLTEFLASHGYIVVGIGHTGSNQIERFPDGYVYRPDVNDPVLSSEQYHKGAKAQWFRSQAALYAERMMPIRVQDLSFVLDHLQTLNVTKGSRFYQRVAVDNAGSMGWSLGGAFSLQSSRDEPRVKAAINLDGAPYTNMPETGTHRPILQMNSGTAPFNIPAADPSWWEMHLLARSLSWKIYSMSSADWYDVTLRSATHAHFSDRTLFEPAPIEPMYPRLAHQIIQKYSLEFFDRYLRGRTETPLLSGALSYPDTDLIKKPLLDGAKGAKP